MNGRITHKHFQIESQDQTNSGSLEKEQQMDPNEKRTPRGLGWLGEEGTGENVPDGKGCLTVRAWYSFPMEPKGTYLLSPGFLYPPAPSHVSTARGREETSVLTH